MYSAVEAQWYCDMATFNDFSPLHLATSYPVSSTLEIVEILSYVERYIVVFCPSAQGVKEEHGILEPTIQQLTAAVLK